MRRLSRLVQIPVIVAVCLSTASLYAHADAVDAASPEASRTGVIKTVRGDVHVVDAEGHRVQASPGDSLQATHRLQTGAASGVSIVLRDGTVLVMGESGSLTLERFSFDATTHEGSLVASLLQGTLRVVTGLLGKKNPEVVRVDTPTATIGIRGTDFIVSAGTKT